MVTIAPFNALRPQAQYARQVAAPPYDVLNSNTNFSSYISSNSIVKNQSTILQRFFLLSFIYNIKPVTAGRQARVEHFSVF